MIDLWKLNEYVVKERNWIKNKQLDVQDKNCQLTFFFNQQIFVIAH